VATTPRKTKLRRQDLPAGACLCDHCTGKCCRYFSLPISTPASWDDYDAIRWYLAHGQTLVYVEEGTWYLVVMTRCKYLSKDDRCQIYLSRPKICREYTTSECEFDEDWIFEKVFETPEQLWEYAEAILPPRRRRKGAGRGAGPALPVITIGSNAREASRHGQPRQPL
jgi:Fe-S-cluster containining protein